jgi:hypothetical protein
MEVKKTTQHHLMTRGKGFNEYSWPLTAKTAKQTTTFIKNFSKTNNKLVS